LRSGRAGLITATRLRPGRTRFEEAPMKAGAPPNAAYAVTGIISLRLGALAVIL